MSAEVFRHYYLQKAEEDELHDYSHMQLDELENMVSSSQGIAVDTEELAIEVVGAIVSGNTAEIVLRVTAKGLDSVLRESGSNYCFFDAHYMLMRSLPGGCEFVGTGFSYSDTVTSLAPNQFELHYRIISKEPLDQDTLVIPFMDFGFYREKNRGFEILYPGNWQVEIALDPAADTSRRGRIDEELALGDHLFSVDDMQITPLACTIHLTCKEDDSYIDEHAMDILQVISEETNRCALTLADGRRLDSSHFEITCRAGGPECSINLPFCGPVAVEDIVSVQIFEKEFFIKDLQGA